MEKRMIVATLKESATHLQGMIVRTEPHDCLRFSELLHCTGTVDTWRCKFCGKQWDEPCNFDEDYS